MRVLLAALTLMMGCTLHLEPDPVDNSLHVGRVSHAPSVPDLQVSLALYSEDGALHPTLGGLHTMHPLGASWGGPLDCSVKNASPQWGPDPAGNPQLSRLSLDDSAIVLRRFAPMGLYRIGVDRAVGSGVVRAVLKVRVGGKVVFSRERVLGYGQSFWDAAAVGWWSNRMVLMPIDRVLGKDGAWPDPQSPLEGGAECLPTGPPCVAPNRCQQSKAQLQWFCATP